MSDPTPIQNYTFEIDLNVVDHLGIQLYSNVPAVLTETVANSWDADATVVNINIDVDKDQIVITDNGHGMSHEEMQKRFLVVGYRRRDEKETCFTPNGRPVMGRKGLGKLAPFSIAEEVTILSRSDAGPAGTKLSLSELKSSAQKKEKYTPPCLDDSSHIPPKNGTVIILNKLSMSRVRVKNLKERLARRFSIIGTDPFRVHIDGDEVTDKDRGDLDKLQYIWCIGDWKAPKWVTEKSEISRPPSYLPDSLEGWADENWKIRGWLGTSKKPNDLASASGNLNSIVLIARGRLFQENILGTINDGRHFTKYLTGAIEADFLDEDDKADIAMSDRQRVSEDDPRYIQLISYLRSILNKLEKNWSQWRAEDGAEEAKTSYPALDKWISDLPIDIRKNAEKVIGRVQSLEIESEEKRQLLKNTALGFEHLKIKGLTSQLEQLMKMDPESILRIISDRDAIEATMFHEIVKQRLQVVKTLKDQTKEDVLEKVLQKTIFDHLWLLEPSWDVVKGSEIMEKSIKEGFDEVSRTLSDDEQKGRLDIRYRQTSGKHLIIELKRARRKCSVMELINQGNKYTQSLKKQLSENGRGKEPFELIFIVGERPADLDPDIHDGMLENMNARIKTYKELIHSAELSYTDYLAESEKLDKLDKILDEITHGPTSND